MRLLFSLCFITSIAIGQTDDLTLQNIKKQYETISKLQEKRLLTERETAYSCKDLSIDGRIIYYYLDQDLQLISHSYHQGHYSAYDTYYISNNTLFFYFSSDGFDNDESIYDENTGELIDTEEDWSRSELRTYFSKEKAIKCLIKQFENEDVTEDMKEKYSNISDYFKNKEKDCDPIKSTRILKSYADLVKFQKLGKENICSLHQ